VLPPLDDYLMRRYADETATGFYQWGTMAAAERLESTSDRRFIDFIARQAERVLDEARWTDMRLQNTCPMIEGLATAAAVLSTRPEYAALATRVAQRVDQEMDKNERLQLPPHAERVPLGDGAYLVSRHLSDFAGAFLSGAPRVYTRIDLTGHCLAAMLKRLNMRAGTTR
jgi:hypothetical protein